MTSQSCLHGVSSSITGKHQMRLKPNFSFPGFRIEAHVGRMSWLSSSVSLWDWSYGRNMIEQEYFLHIILSNHGSRGRVKYQLFLKYLTYRSYLLIPVKVCWVLAGIDHQLLEQWIWKDILSCCLWILLDNDFTSTSILALPFIYLSISIHLLSIYLLCLAIYINLSVNLSFICLFVCLISKSHAYEETKKKDREEEKKGERRHRHRKIVLKLFSYESHQAVTSLQLSFFFFLWEKSIHWVSSMPCRFNF